MPLPRIPTVVPASRGRWILRAEMRAYDPGAASPGVARATVRMTEPLNMDPEWTFLTNHAHVLLCISRDHDARLRDIATDVGITERAVQRIVVELEAAGVVARERRGRRNHYMVNGNVALRHWLESHRSVGDLIRFLKRRSEQ